ncbi:ABC transporter ATP-binding protein [Haloarcula salinisoli]|uniref:ABC transporter ATP-binding protein/permease n=1 Tax=Haloarcula salinisoli TaxID=2487746 RepID=A0A8J7YJJ7_9EURY|nr:ABC transporter ATP-binding protein [Halomicroarcula salinisoli]MBX0286119.1 ABC transporter ATP-binding protein/permease [Halomicroarcula salinisoli]MBX0302393.1 ABC transporter ATP-binding protein/permease [Halomicroarcula salinisoli]
MADDDGGFEGVRENVDGNPILKLVGYARPYRIRLIAGILTSFMTRFARLVPPIIVAAAIDRIISQRSDPGLLTQAGLLPPGEITTEAARVSFLQRLVVIAAIAYLIRSATRFASRYLLQSSAQKIQRDLRNDTYDHLQRLSMDFFANHQTGGMMSILNSDINRLESFLNTEFRQIIRVVATVGGIAFILYTYSPLLALVALAPVPIIGLASYLFLSYIEPRYRSIRQTVSRLNTRLENNLSGAPVIKAFDRYDFENGRVSQQSQQYHDEKVAALRIRRAFFAGLRLLTGVVFVAILYIAGMDVITSPENEAILSAGGFAAFFLYIRRLYSPMRRVGKSANKYQLAKSSAERVFGLLGQDPTITDPEDPYTPERIDGTVEFDDVTFGYGDGEPVVRNASLDVPSGATVGLAGPTGAGKSTLLKLVPRFHDVNAGSVSVDGVDVREYALRALRADIAVVEQNPYLFSGTVAENIAYGDRDVLDGEADGDEGARERVREAARSAQAHEFVRDLPEGYDTEIGERGIKLSGGQRQRVAIARALLNDPEIIIFDEATSDVDTETERAIQESIERLVENRTAFVIAHRLSTIQDADTIVVMDEGEIVERGSHDELLSTGGEYADLWAAQADEQPVSADD